MPKIARLSLLIGGGGVLLLVLALINRPTPERDTHAGVGPQNSEVSTRRLVNNHWVIAKRDREAYLSDLAGASRQITLMPVPGEEKDSVKHLVVSAIDLNSPMYAVGLRKDDLILLVNGSPIGTMGRAVNLVHEIKSCDCLTLKVQRGDELSDYRFDFQ